MANEEHLSILEQGVDAWNKWRTEHPLIRPDLSGADFSEGTLILRWVDLSTADLSFANFSGLDLSSANLVSAILLGANLSNATLVGTVLMNANLMSANLGGANLSNANLDWANLIGSNLIGTTFVGTSLAGTLLVGTNLSGVNLSNASLIKANVGGANLSGANLSNANLTEANLSNTNLNKANLAKANLSFAIFVKTNLEGATLTDCFVYGISVWDTNLTGASQANLAITEAGEPTITVDNLQVAQFIYLLLHNEKIRDVIDTIANKAVLILGRFSDEIRKEILHALREKIRANGYLPIIFDFEKAKERDFTETIKILAGMSLFVIADITNPRSTPLELQATVPDYMVPFVPILQEGENEFAMFVDLQTKYHWVMDIRRYKDKKHLIEHFETGIIRPALEMHKRLLIEKNETLKSKSIDEF